MATIKVSTNSDPALDVLMLTQGHPMVPSLGVINLTYAPYGTMLDQQGEVLGFRGQFKIMHAGFYGVYGPAWAARMELDPIEYDNFNQTHTLKVTNDVLKAGIQWGASHSFYISFVGEKYEFDHWDGLWPVFEWHKTDDINFVIPLDFIQIIFYAIQIIQGLRDYIANQDLTPQEEKDLQGKRQTFERIKERGGLTDTELKMIEPPRLPIAQIPPEKMILPMLWGLVDQAEGTFNKSGWSAEYVFPAGVKNIHNGDYMQMKAYPGLVQAIDIYRLLVNWDRNVHQFAGSLYLFDRTIRFLHCDVSLGVNVGVIFPFQVSLKNIQFNGPYNKDVVGDFTYNSSDNTFTGKIKTPEPSMPTYNSATLAQYYLMYFAFSTGADFRFGIFGSATFFAVLSLSFSIDWNVLEDWFHLSWRLQEEGVKIGGNYPPSSSARSTVDTMDEIEVVFA
jgi:hypothetical protein